MAVRQSPIKAGSLRVSKARPLRLLPSPNPQGGPIDPTQANLHRTQENEFIQKVLGVKGALVLVLDRDGRVSHANAACEALSGLDASYIVGRPIWELLTPLTKISPDQWNLADLAAMTGAESFESYWRTVEGELRHIRWETIRLTRPDGAPGDVIVTGLDISGRQDGEAVLRQELDMMRAIMEDLPCHIYFKDRESRFTRLSWANGSPLGIIDLDIEKAIGKTDFDFFTEEHARQAYEDEQEIIRTGLPFNNEERETHDGRPDTWVLTTKLPLRDANQEIIGTFGMSVDITARKATEEELRLRVRLFAALAQFTTTVNTIREPGALADVLAEAIIKVVPSTTAAIVLLNPEDGKYYVRSVRGLDPRAVGVLIEPGDGTSGRVIVGQKMIFTEPNSQSQFGAGLRKYMPNQSFRTVGVPLIHEGAVLGVISLSRLESKTPFAPPEREILELLGAHAALALANAHLSEQISTLAIHDGLTGLYNRRHFDAALELALARAKRRTTGAGLVAIMFDLDHFGLFNERYRHLGGDALLRHFACLLGSRLRAADIVARYGGEEFVAILEDCSLDEAIRLAEGLRRDLEESVVLSSEGEEMRATVSAGAAILDLADPRAEALIGAADEALYAAKAAGRNRVVVQTGLSV